MEPEPSSPLLDGGQPPPQDAQVEGEAVQSPVENPTDKASVMEEDSLIKEKDAEADVAKTAEDALQPKEENRDDAVKAAASEPGDDPKVSAAGDEVKTEAGEVTKREVDKLENGDGDVKARSGKDGPTVEGDDSNDDENTRDATPLKQEDGGKEQALPKSSNNSFMFDYTHGGDDSGTEEEQAAFMKELEHFYKSRSLEFKPPKFYGEGLNCLKLWRQVTGLGGYEQVTSCKLWRQVGESFKPPKTCTTVSWTFRNFYEKALLEYEKYKVETGEFQVAASTLSDRIAAETQIGNHASGSGRARRESATRAMQGWHSQRLLGNGEIADPIIKDKGTVSIVKKDKHVKSSGSGKRKRTPTMEQDDRLPTSKADKIQSDSMVVDVGAPADWVKINVRRTKDCYEVYALVPGLLREEVQVQSDPAGRLVVTGEPEQPDNPWGVTPFKKVITLPSRIDPHQTSAVVTLHGQLFVRAPFEQSKS